MISRVNNFLSLFFALLFVVDHGLSQIDIPDGIPFESGKACGVSEDEGCSGVDVCLNAQDVGNWVYGQDTDSCTWCDSTEDCSDDAECIMVGICEYTDGEIFVDGVLCSQECSMCISAGVSQNYFLCGCVYEYEAEEEEEEEEALMMLPSRRNRKLSSSYPCPEDYACYPQPQLGGFCVGESSDEPCISGHTTVDVLGKGLTQADDLQVGDKIMTNNGQYEKVFAFGHVNTYALGDFFQINTDESTDGDVLEITGQHLMFKEGAAVPASMVTELDVVDGVKVTQIERLNRQGLYSPLVKGGVFQAGGVTISSYTSISNTGSYTPSMNIGNLFEISFHTLQHMAISPYRLLNHLGLTFEERNGEGQLLFVAAGEELVKSFLSYGSIGQFIVSTLVVTAMGPIYLLESAGNVLLASVLLCLVFTYTLFVKK